MMVCDHLSKEIEDIVNSVANILMKNNITLSIAESYTGGMVSSLLVHKPGISRVFWGSIIAYSNNAKVKILGVNPMSIERFGAVSEKVATEMAVGARKLGGTDVGLSTTGIAGPTGGSKLKPVGLGYIGVAMEDKVKVWKHRCTGDRKDIILNASLSALKYLKQSLEELE